MGVDCQKLKIRDYDYRLVLCLLKHLLRIIKQITIQMSLFGLERALGNRYLNLKPSLARSPKTTCCNTRLLLPMYIQASGRVGICEIKRTREASVLSQSSFSRISMILRQRKSAEEFLEEPLYALHGTSLVAIGTSTVVAALIRLFKLLALMGVPTSSIMRWKG